MSATTVIDRPPGDVYGFVSDPANDVHWRTGVTDAGLTTPPPIGLGSEGYARAGGRETRWKVVAFTPGRSYDWELTAGPFSGTGGYRIEPEGDGTRFTLVSDVGAGGFYRLLGPVFSRMGQRQNRADVERLKRLLEGETETS